MSKQQIGRRWLAIAAAGALLAACTSSVEPQPSDSTPAGTNDVRVYFVADTPQGLKLFTELHSYPGDQPDPEQVIGELIDGTLQPKDPDLTNLWGNGNKLLSLQRSGNAMVVDLDFAGLNVGAAAEMMAIMQVVWTLGEVHPRAQYVTFLVNGQPVENLAGHVDATKPFEPGSDFEWLNAVTIDYPNQNETVSGSVVVSGMACTFEANVAWELRQAGAVVDSGAVTAAEACPARSPWQLELGKLAAGKYKIRAMEYSAKDGSLVAVDDREFTVE